MFSRDNKTVIVFVGLQPLPESVWVHVLSSLAEITAVHDRRWLSEFRAIEIYSVCTDKARMHAYIAKTLPDFLQSHAIDYFILDLATRSKKILVTDVDSTLIQNECIDELGRMAGVEKAVSEMTASAMHGAIPFDEALRKRVALLRGLPASALEAVYANALRLTPGARTLSATLREQGLHLVMVSGGFTYFTARLSEELGFHHHHANTLEIRDGVLTGEVSGPIIDKETKRRILIQHCATLRFDTSLAIALGDGANDLPMLITAGDGIAYHAKPIVEQTVMNRIRYNDLTAVLFALGLADYQFSAIEEENSAELKKT